MPDIIMPYKPREAFKKYHKSTKRFNLIIAHRRSGKSVAGINRCIRRFLDFKRENRSMIRVGYIAPYLKQAKSLIWDYLKFYTEPLSPIRTINESELKVDFGNGHIRLYGADNPESIRGGYFDHVMLDEFAFFSPSVFPMIIRPILS